ncbi:MAG: hypothetical protein ABIY50_02410 [Ignavibacteria bacterium]
MKKISWKYILWTVLIIVQAYWIFNSDGFYFIDDSCHFNFNRHYFESYTGSTDAWHRMGRLLLFAIPAQFGLKGVQIASSVLFLLTIFFAYKILIHKNVKYAEWIIPLIGFQPVLFNISYTSLAELPAAFLIILSYYYFIKEKPSFVMITSSLIFIFRTEYFYVAGIFFLIYLFRKNYKVCLLIFIGPLLWYIYTTVITLDPLQFFRDMLLHSRLEKIDAGIDWYYYIIHSAKIFGVIQMILLISGLIIILIKKQFRQYGLILIFIVSGIGLQTLLALKGLNLTCSIGQLRYVAVVGPLIGIISVIGLGSFYNLLKFTYLRKIIQILILIVLFILGPYFTPFHNKYGMDIITEEIAKSAANEYPDYKVLSQMHQLANAMDEPFLGGETFKKLNDSTVQRFDKSLIVWCNYLEGNAFVIKNLSLKQIESLPNIKLIKEYIDTVNNCTSVPVYKYRKEGDEYKTSREIIDYLVEGQTSWETYHIKVFKKE